MKPQRDSNTVTLPSAPSLMQWLKASREQAGSTLSRRPGLGARWKSSDRVAIAGRS